jgi:hypothetical protein
MKNILGAREPLGDMNMTISTRKYVVSFNLMAVGEGYSCHKESVGRSTAQLKLRERDCFRLVGCISMPLRCG